MKTVQFAQWVVNNNTVTNSHIEIQRTIIKKINRKRLTVTDKNERTPEIGNRLSDS